MISLSLELAVESGDHSLAAVCRLLVAVASPVGERRPWDVGSAAAAQGLLSAGSAAVAFGPSRPATWGSFLDGRSDQCPLHSLDHQGSPRRLLLRFLNSL